MISHLTECGERDIVFVKIRIITHFRFAIFARAIHWDKSVHAWRLIQKIGRKGLYVVNYVLTWPPPTFLPLPPAQTIARILNARNLGIQ